jgi:4'-phosphopantetheinyl transferase
LQTPFNQLPRLIESLDAALHSYLDVPFIFFGHSMGALISFELAHLLRRERHLSPAHLFVSGHRAPHLPDPEPPLHSLPDQAFVAGLRQRYNGVPDMILQDAELMQIFSAFSVQMFPGSHFYLQNGRVLLLQTIAQELTGLLIQLGVQHAWQPGVIHGRLRTDLALSSTDIHVWRVAPDQPERIVQQLHLALSTDEQARASRFHFERDRTRFVVGHGALRVILGRYLGLEPDQVRFEYGPHGKPLLAPPGSNGLCFNASHSQGLGLCAVAQQREIGVDLEHMHPVADAEQIAERFFSAQENAALRALPANQRQEAFFNCWTRKEAFIKAVGDGLSHLLNQLGVTKSG